MEKKPLGTDYMVIQFDGTPLAFTDEDVMGEIVIYGDLEEALIDYNPEENDLGISSIYYFDEDGISVAFITKPGSEQILGSFNYDEKQDNFQTRLKTFLKEHPFC